MKNILLGLIGCLSIGGAVSAEPPTPLEFACAYIEADCEGITMPLVIYTRIMGEVGLYGAYYPGEHAVYIDPDAPGHTVVHEVTHYVLYEAGMRFSRCTSEEAARRVHHAWNGTDYDDKWRDRYGCNPTASTGAPFRWGRI